MSAVEFWQLGNRTAPFFLEQRENRDPMVTNRETRVSTVKASVFLKDWVRFKADQHSMEPHLIHQPVPNRACAVALVHTHPDRVIRDRATSRTTAASGPVHNGIDNTPVETGAFNYTEERPGRHPACLLGCGPTTCLSV